MLSYRHSFHAGNHADVLKHTVQSLIIDALKQKEKPFIYHDTHSGVGRYDLQHEWPQKTGEYKQGIAKIWDETKFPAEMTSYLKVLKKLNKNCNLRYYPGSPLIAYYKIRKQDRMILTELHSKDFPLLQQEFAQDRRVNIYNQDGFAYLKAKLPPLIRRGLVLIDPPYELESEYDDTLLAILSSYKRWATGIYAIWYPVVYRHKIDKMLNELVGSGIRKILQFELGVSKDTQERGMTASGMIVINPPWKLKEQMGLVLPFLQEKIAPNTGHWKAEWIVSE